MKKSMHLCLEVCLIWFGLVINVFPHISKTPAAYNVTSNNDDGRIRAISIIHCINFSSCISCIPCVFSNYSFRPIKSYSHGTCASLISFLGLHGNVLYT